MNDHVERDPASDDGKVGRSPYGEGSPPAPRHCHAYAWVGSSRHFGEAAERRPEFESAFAGSEVTPFWLADWLRRPRRLIRSTFTDPVEAARWIRARAEEILPSLLHPEEAESLPLARREANAADTLRWGGDVAWGFHLRDGRFASFSLISCPNRMAPELPCPER